MHRAAFAPLTPAGAPVVEGRLVDQLRAGPWWLPQFSLVAVASNGDVVGHVVATRAVLEPAGTPVLGLGPLGVLPAWQRRGVGSALMDAVLSAAQACDEVLVGLLGDPAYYRRFGFVPSVQHQVVAPDPAWGPAFQVRLLGQAVGGGTFRYAEPVQHLG
ncbi:GNAT family N-acetyltransferase [Pseudonocardia artemisiae]